MLTTGFTGWVAYSSSMSYMSFSSSLARTGLSSIFIIFLFSLVGLFIGVAYSNMLTSFSTTFISFFHLIEEIFFLPECCPESLSVQLLQVVVVIFLFLRHL